ncbi:hypothetical protein [Allobranchiibius sp. GilTou73]|uniref:YunG family protein n=1 Tax=Allobranchiibius sp. GilTou73 TaxID=2904523 RepID=UPI001F253A53|nr:hypothetical protein [Allobranchiibius sp. GilTou73]UIJ33947.1 hypothetical protein LVQ62_12460 [Allobranchiibius sp. GilTou73]
MATAAHDNSPEPSPTLADLRTAFLASWGSDTCYPESEHEWSDSNPARDQCGMTALVAHDVLGGEIILAEVHVAGTKVGHHYWNVLPDGTPVDFTAGQFRPDEVITNAHPVIRPPDAPHRHRDRYELLRCRVLDYLERARDETLEARQAR